MSTAFDHHQFEQTLTPGTTVEVRWSAGSGGHYRGKAKVLRVNKSSIRVALTEEVVSQSAGVYTIGWELTVPRALANKWSPEINSIHPTKD